MLIQRLVRQGSQDAWLMPFWAGSFGVIFALLWIVLFRYHPNKSLVQIPLVVWGRPFGVVISMLYFLFICLMAGWVLRNLSDFLNATIMPETPKSIFHVMFLLVACYTVSLGAETVARFNQLITPFLFFPFWFILLLAALNWDWERFQPVLQSDIWRNMIEYHSFLGFPYMETISLTLLLPLARQGGGRAFVLGIVTATISLSLTLFMIIGLLGVERASRLTFPIYTVIQEVSIGEMIVNIHSVISVVLLILIFIKLLVLVFGAHECLQQVFEPQTKWPHLLAVTILMSAIAECIYENPIQNGEWNEKYTFVCFSFFALFIPLLLLATTWLNRSFGNQKKRSAG